MFSLWVWIVLPVSFSFIILICSCDFSDNSALILRSAKAVSSARIPVGSVVPLPVIKAFSSARENAFDICAVICFSRL